MSYSIWERITLGTQQQIHAARYLIDVFGYEDVKVNVPLKTQSGRQLGTATIDMTGLHNLTDLDYKTMTKHIKIDMNNVTDIPDIIADGEGIEVKTRSSVYIKEYGDKIPFEIFQQRGSAVDAPEFMYNDSIKKILFLDRSYAYTQHKVNGTSHAKKYPHVLYNNINIDNNSSCIIFEDVNALRNNISHIMKSEGVIINGHGKGLVTPTFNKDTTSLISKGFIVKGHQSQNMAGLAYSFCDGSFNNTRHMRNNKAFDFKVRYNKDDIVILKALYTKNDNAIAKHGYNRYYMNMFNNSKDTLHRG